MALQEPAEGDGTGWAWSPCSPQASHWGAKTTCTCCQPNNGVFMIHYSIVPSQQLNLLKGVIQEETWFWGWEEVPVPWSRLTKLQTFEQLTLAERT